MRDHSLLKSASNLNQCEEVRTYAGSKMPTTEAIPIMVQTRNNDPQDTAVMHLESVDDFSHSLEVYNGNEDDMIHHQGVISPAAAVSAVDQVSPHLQYPSKMFIIFAHTANSSFSMR